MAEALPIEGGEDFHGTGMACLPCARTVTDDGRPVLVTRWVLTKPELEEINRTGQVYVSFIADRPPPTSVSAVDPRFEHPLNGGPSA